jgi:hypothetical protein
MSYLFNCYEKKPSNLYAKFLTNGLKNNQIFYYKKDLP